MKLGRLGILTAMATVASIAWATPSMADSAPGAAKEALVGPLANVYCIDVTPVPSEDASRAGPGSVVFNVDQAGRVHANVKLKKAQPHTTYVVRLIQGNGGDCYTVDATVTTNGRGNGNVNVVEALVPGTTAIQIFIDTGAIFNTPTYRGEERYLVSRLGGADRQQRVTCRGTSRHKC
jgi:hypothetical protein